MKIRAFSEQQQIRQRQVVRWLRRILRKRRYLDNDVGWEGFMLVARVKVEADVSLGVVMMPWTILDMERAELEREFNESVDEALLNSRNLYDSPSISISMEQVFAEFRHLGRGHSPVVD